MQNRIRILDQLCINQIAAGEVVERPLSVVKELVENSLDADAKSIEITIEGSGTDLIRVKDDGAGIPSEDLQTAVLPHATSKITGIEDLDSLATLGFRGEALPSIASVSRLEIISRTTGAELGTRLFMESCEVKSLEEAGSPKGTMVTVKLFVYTTPARYKFLKSQGTEFGLISDMVSKLALTKPQVAFTLKHGKNTVFMSPGNGSLKHVITSVMGSQISQKLLEVSFKNERYSVSGFISLPELTRNNTNYQIFIINGRIVYSKALRQAVKNAFHTSIPHNTHPVFVLNIELSPALYDVNVHPSKMEIKFKNENELISFLTLEINKAIFAGRKIEHLNLSETYRQSEPAGLKEDPKRYNINKSVTPAYYQPNIFTGNTAKNIETIKTLNDRFSHPVTTNVLSLENEKYDASQINDLIGDDKKPETNNLAENNLDINILKENDDSNANRDFNTKNIFINLRPLAQIMGTYILATNDESLFIIDQHAAHERITFEKIFHSFTEDSPDSQMLLLPITLNLSVHEEQIVLNNFDLLRNSGFILEQFGDRTYLLRGVPLIKNLDNPEEIFISFIDELMKSKVSISLENIIEKWIFTAACRNSIKGNEFLTIHEMQALLYNLGQLDNPYTCPHGRPVIIEITQEELTKKFKRDYS